MMKQFTQFICLVALSAGITAWYPAWSQTPAPPPTPPASTAPAAVPEQMPAHNQPPAATPPSPGTRMPSPPGAYVYIGWPIDGAVIRSNRVKVWFGTRDFGVAPAGTFVPNTGHHHLLIDTDLPPLDQQIPNDKQHLHFGGGQTETVIELPPGKHTLQLLMADGNHVPHNPPLYSRKITIYVRPE
jgi:hypothetical protein